MSLLVSGDSTLKNALNYLITVVLKKGFEAVDCGTLAQGVLGKNPSIKIVFVHLPEYSSKTLDLIKFAKSGECAAVVIVLHSGDPELGVKSFLAGADDAIAWPCSLHELAVRVHVRLRCSLDKKLFHDDHVNWNAEAHIADRAGLTTSEAQVMSVLYRHDGEIVSRDKLSLAVDARPWRYGDRKFDVHVAKIRKKLLESFGDKVSVSTFRSLGYRLVTKSSDIFDSV